MNQFRTPPEKRPLRAPALAATTFAVIAAAVAGSCGSEAASDQGSASTVRRIHLIEIERGNTQLNLGRKGFSPGDRQTIASDVYNRAGRKVGRLDADCAITAVGKRAGAVCGSVITLPNGQLTGQISGASLRRAQRTKRSPAAPTSTPALAGRSASAARVTGLLS